MKESTGSFAIIRTAKPSLTQKRQIFPDSLKYKA